MAAEEGQYLSGDDLKITAWCSFSRPSWSRQDHIHGQCQLLLAYLETWHWVTYCPVSLLCWNKGNNKNSSNFGVSITRRTLRCYRYWPPSASTQPPRLFLYPGVRRSLQWIYCPGSFTQSATTVAHAFVPLLICPYTTPRVLLSDKGTEFKNHILQDICTQFSIKQTFIKAHHPASNGLVERKNRKILEILRQLAGKFYEPWEDWLYHVAKSINGSINTSTGKTPHYILCGFDKRLPYDMLVHPPVPLHPLDDYSKLQLHRFHTIHESVREKHKASKEMLHKQHAQATLAINQIGDSVMKRAQDRSCEISSKFSCPFLVTSRCHPNNFKMLDPSNNVTEVAHVDHLNNFSASFTPATIPSSPPYCWRNIWFLQPFSGLFFR